MVSFVDSRKFIEDRAKDSTAGAYSLANDLFDLFPGKTGLRSKYSILSVIRRFRARSKAAKRRPATVEAYC